MAERARLARDARREAILTDRRDPVGTGPLDHKRPGPNQLTDSTWSWLRFPGEDRLIEPHVGGRQDRAVRDHLIPRRDHHHVVDHNLLDLDRPGLAVASHVRVRRDQQREAIERTLRTHLLADPDRRVGNDDPQK